MISSDCRSTSGSQPNGRAPLQRLQAVCVAGLRSRCLILLARNVEPAAHCARLLTGRRRVQPDAAPSSHRNGSCKQSVIRNTLVPGTACRTNAGADLSLSPASSALAGRGNFSHLRGNRAIGIHRDVKGEVYVEVRCSPVADYWEAEGPGCLHAGLAVEGGSIR